MNTKNTTTPPYSKANRETRIYDFDLEKFTKTISKLTTSLLADIKISVLVVGKNGKCIDVLQSKLAREEFDALAERAAYTKYEGSPEGLNELLGVPKSKPITGVVC